ncbi:Serine/threonine-protein kinase brsk1 [Boothiomyces sp. JEL0866]|nr:Serine/threonine-protein kinase brsk1 [Boothiomyces sp. JEL0866]
MAEVTEPPAYEKQKSFSAAPSGSPNGATPRSTSTGQKIGPYVLGKTLGVGSTGRVKLAVHMETNQKVAIKIISKDNPETPGKKNPAVEKKLDREITIMKLIQQYLVLEHVEGGELFDYLVKKGRLSESEAVQFFQQIIFGVEYCHRHLICHRDLKPENLLLDKDYNVKVADFGMANMIVQSKMLETSCGSPHYASPEIIRGEKYDGRTSDVWSCGIILFALVTGNLPFDDSNIRRLLTKVKTGVYHIPEHVSPPARDLIKKMLTVEPASRITLQQVMKHEFFLSRPPKNNQTVMPSMLESDNFSQGYPKNFKFEADILDSLTLLGWDNRENLIECLHAEGTNAEKVFYNLLHRRKWEMLENYNSEKPDKVDPDGNTPVRRADSFCSDNLEPLTKREPTSNRRAFSEGGPGPARQTTITVKSPLAAEAKLTTDSDEGIAKQETDSPQKTPTIKKAVGGKRKGPLAINTISNGEAGEPSPVSASLKSPAIATAFAAIGLGTPKFHRKGTLASEVPSSPVISNTPKTSWFHNIFNFKPDTYYLISQAPLPETLVQAEELLNSMHISFKPGAPGVLKCKFDADGSSDNDVANTESKGVKFRIEIVTDEEDSTKLRVQLIHQQGAFSTFQNLVGKLQASWGNKEPQSS